MCGTGNLQACEVMYAFEMARSGAAGGSQVSGGGGSPADSKNHTISARPDNGDFVRGGAAGGGGRLGPMIEGKTGGSSRPNNAILAPVTRPAGGIR